MTRLLLGVPLCAAIGFAIGYGSPTRAEPRSDTASRAGCPDIPAERAPVAWSTSPQDGGDGALDSPLDPRSPRYDAPAATRVLSVDIAELWEREGRDTTFAPAREQFLRTRFSQLLRELVAGADVSDVECRRGTCVLTVSSAAVDVELLDGALGFVPFGDLFESSEPEIADGRASIHIDVAYANAHLDEASFERWFEALWAERWRLARERYVRDHGDAGVGEEPAR